jgi:hypothetical protein
MMVSGQIELNAAIHTLSLTFVTLLGTFQSTCRRCEENQRFVSYRRQSLYAGYVHSYVPIHVGLRQRYQGSFSGQVTFQ